MSFTVFSYNATVLLIQPNPTHHMCWKMRPNPTHVHLWSVAAGLLLRARRRQEISIDRLLRGRRSCECGQYHVVSVRR